METETNSETQTPTIEELTAKVTSMTEDNDWLSKRLAVARDTITKVENYIKQVVSDGEVDAEESLITDLCDILELELTQEVEITLTATLTTTVTIPVGKSVSDYDGEVTAEFSSNDSNFDLGYSTEADEVEVQEA
jgi:hypothetical protein